MMYYSPIEIKRTAQPNSYTNKYKIQDIELSLAELSTYVTGDETFSIFNDDMEIHVYGRRLETPDEMNNRIEKQEAYMVGYYKYHNNKKKK